MDYEPWTIDYEPWTIDHGLWTMNHGLLPTVFLPLLLQKTFCMGTAVSIGVITLAHIEKLKAIVGDGYVFEDEETRAHHGHDETERLLYLPDVVVKPRTAT